MSAGRSIEEEAVGAELLAVLKCQHKILFRPLKASEVDEAHALEVASYPADEAASHEGFTFRQREAGDYFWAAFDIASGAIVALVCGTLCNGDTLTHDTMHKHDPAGTTLCIHSVAVAAPRRAAAVALRVAVAAPRRRGGVATAALHAYLRAAAALRPRVARALLIAKPHNLGLYARCGFAPRGLSAVAHGADAWVEMALELSAVAPRALPWALVDAFAARACAGNAAAVFFTHAGGDAAWMQSVAMELNQSETAFVERVVPEDGDDEATLGPLFRLRWFTPAAEVDLCGHATLAAAHALWDTQRAPAAAPIRFSTLSGILTCRHGGSGSDSSGGDSGGGGSGGDGGSGSNGSSSGGSGLITLDFPEEPPRPIADAAAAAAAAAALGLAPADLLYFGRNRLDLLLEVPPAAFAQRLAPDFGTLAALPLEHRGVLVTRCFFPRFGIPEDPVTGSAHCCLARYWADKLGRDELTGYQASKRGGTVRMTLRRGEGRVVLGGRAVTAAELGAVAGAGDGDDGSARRSLLAVPKLGMALTGRDEAGGGTPSKGTGSFWVHAGKTLSPVSSIDLGRENIATGTIWLPLEVGAVGDEGGPYVKLRRCTLKESHTNVAAAWSVSMAPPPERPNLQKRPASTVAATMCLMNYGTYQAAPWELPMYDMLQRGQCSAASAVQEGRIAIISMDDALRGQCSAASAVQEGRIAIISMDDALEGRVAIISMDDALALAGSDADALQLGGFVFHDTRCGSTLVANQLAILPENRVFSESRPPVQCLRMYTGYQAVDPERPDLKMDEALFNKCFKGVLALMKRARGDAEPHERIFFKFAPVVTSMFPDVPWVYLFRDPVEVMVSNIGRGELAAPCVREGVRAARLQQKETGAGSDWLARTRRSSKALDPEVMENLGNICAEWLLSLDQAAIDAQEAHPSTAAFLDYRQLPEAVPKYLYTEHFKSWDWRTAMSDAASHYSKSLGGTSRGAAGGDAQHKHEIAAPQIVAAAEGALYDSYHVMSEMQPWRKPAFDGNESNRRH
ncbi:hypothetical protein JKP88DRAFT_288513 [Tribonema minus]|uniref:N-acetyltransferase domain-containing protein n=1 Tax=Tribonema minus TaxID=303371 RepID=A0A835ZD42_9STRA|nr:hypothetical protein JKP88DRAFT_288513 [Tribonema minus]